MTDTTPEPIDDAAEQAELSEQKAVRLAKRQRLIDEATSGAGGAYPVTLPITDTIPAVRARYGELQPDEATGVTVGVVLVCALARASAWETAAR